MVKSTSKGTVLSSSASLHHRSQDEEGAGVYRHPYQNQDSQHQSDCDENPAQWPAVCPVVDPTPWPGFLHDEGLPRRHRRHTCPLEHEERR